MVLKLAVLQLVLFSLLLTLHQVSPSDHHRVRRKGIEANSPLPAVASSSLLQRRHNVQTKAYRHVDHAEAGSSNLMVNARLSSTGFQRPQDSPVQRFIDKYPWWYLLAAVASVIGLIVMLLKILTYVLDQYETSRWSHGQVGRPWYVDDGMTMKVGGGALMIWVAIGMFVFTRLVHFRTKDGVRPLNRIEAIYLCCQIITTVGYGDLTPSDPAGQVLVAIFILFGIVLVGVVFTEMLKALMRGGERAVIRAICTKDGRREKGMKSKESPADMVEAEIAHNLATDDEDEQRRVYIEFVFSLTPFVLTLVVGTVFFRYYPGEDKTIWQAFYMACVTLTSVGFGAVTPNTQGGKAFASVWMLFGVGATAHMIICFTNWFLKRHREIQVGHLQVELLAEMDLDGNHAVDKCEFLRFELVRTGLCQKEDIDTILSRFQKLDIDGSGSIDIEDLRKIRRVNTQQELAFASNRGRLQRSTTASSVAGAGS